MTLPDILPAPWGLVSKLAATALIALSIYAVGRHDGADHVRSQWQAATVKQALTVAEAERAYRQREQAMIQQLQKVQYESVQRETALRVAADAAAASAGGLRHELAAVRGRLSAATADACRATADAALELFGKCADEYRGMAAAAQGHADDVKTMSDSWPK